MLRRAVLLTVIIAVTATALLVVFDWPRSSARAPKPGPEWVEAQPPRLPDGPITLRVAHVVNRRLPHFSPAQIELLLHAAQVTTERSLGVRITFELTGTMEIDDLFRARPLDAWQELRKAIVAPNPGPDEVALLARSTYDGLRADRVSTEEARQFVLALPDRHSGAQSLETLATALVSRQLDGLARWRSLRASDGQAVISKEPHHEWMAWSALGYGSLPFDVVITNQLIASAEHHGNAIHTMLRGGVSIGTTFYSRDAKFQAYVVLSTFMFSDELPAVVGARDDGSYSDSEAADLAGAYLAHELGHQLLRLGHPYGNEACVMRPAVMFQFRKWRERLDPAKCPLGSDPQMTPGAVTLGYDRRLVR